MADSNESNKGRQNHRKMVNLNCTSDSRSNKISTIILTVIIGLLSGLCAFALKWLIKLITNIVTTHLSFALPIIPLFSIVLTSIFCRYIVKADFSYCTLRILTALNSNKPEINTNAIYSPIIASSITLGLGGSAGAEGPIADTGAAIGSNIAQIFRLNSKMLKLMIGCGACAGIAGIFKAPIGGVMFALEILKIPISAFSLILLLTSAITATATASLLSGTSTDITINTAIHFEPEMLPFTLLFGVFCGLYSLYYDFTFERIGQILDRTKNPWIKNILAGSLLSVLIFTFPALYGEGYQTVEHITNGNFQNLFSNSPIHYIIGSNSTISLILLSAGFILAKSITASATNSGGGVCGDFAPTLVAGGVAGFFFSLLLNELFGFNLNKATFSLLSMAGVMAGVIRAPFLAIFLTCETTAAFSCFAPLTLTSFISFGIVRIFTSKTFFSHRLKGFRHPILP